MKLNFLINIILLILSNINFTIYSCNIIQNTNNNNKNINISLAPMLEKVLPAVVSIYTEGLKHRQYNFPKEFKYFFGPNSPINIKPFEGIGSGVIINSNKGYIITNYHVINNSNKIKIKLNNDKELYAELLGGDNKTDIAILKLINPPKNLVEIKIANSDNIKVGDFVVAIGNPFGLGQTATSGIISALGRNGLLNYNNEIENFIQTDASINKGNSGGALVNLNGELIGINTAILAPNGGSIGIGFAIPSNIIKSLSYQIIKYGEVKKIQLGIKGIEVTSEISKTFNINSNNGIFISEVLYDSIAYKHGIKPGDTIISVNNKKINNFHELKIKIRTLLPEENIKLEILRDKKIININIKSNYLIKLREENLSYLFEGVILKNCKNNSGIKVENIIKNSPSYLIGLRKGDIITEFNKKKIFNLDELKKLLNYENKLIVLSVIRNNENVFLIFKK